MVYLSQSYGKLRHQGIQIHSTAIGMREGIAGPTATAMAPKYPKTVYSGRYERRNSLSHSMTMSMALRYALHSTGIRIKKRIARETGCDIKVCSTYSWQGFLPGYQGRDNDNYGYGYVTKVFNTVDRDVQYTVCVGMVTITMATSGAQCIIKGTVSRDFLLLVFFMNQFPPKPLSIPLGPFRIFSKICGDIRSSRLTTGINDTNNLTVNSKQ
jgi:hypothetical protein